LKEETMDLEQAGDLIYERDVHELTKAASNGKLNRREFLARAAALGIGVALADTLFVNSSVAAAMADRRAEERAAIAKGLQLVRWVSPRGTLDVADDYANWVAEEMGYWRELGIKSQLNAGPSDATAGPKFVAAGTADMAYPSPGVYSLALQAGLPLISVWEMGALDVFDFAVRLDSPINSIKDLKGKTILLGSIGWSSICAPELASHGVDPNSVHYEAAGIGLWGQALKSGKGDAALSWEGLRAQWDGTGLKFKYPYLGIKQSKFPANSFVIRRADLNSAAKRDLYIRYLRGWAMGLEFGYWNPVAATQIVFKWRPAFAHSGIKPAEAVASLRQLAHVFRGRWAHRQRISGLRSPWGWHEISQWQAFLSTIFKIHQISKRLQPHQILTNELVAEANRFDHARVRRDALHYKLHGAFAHIPVTRAP
jgi:NitT/TauT family transport system substrate-binding protein